MGSGFGGGGYFHTKFNSTVHLLISTAVANHSPPQSTMSLREVIIMKYIKEAKRSKTNIEVGSSVTKNVREMDNNIMELRISIVRKEVVVCDQDVVWKKKFILQFEYGQRR